MANIIITLITLIIAGVSVYWMAARHHSKRSTEEIDDGLSVEEEYPVNAPTITREDWRNRFEHVGLGSRWEQMERLSKEEIRLTPLVVDEQEIKVGASKIGGCPDLPIGQNWFKDGNGKSLSFLAQVNFGDTKAFDSNHQLPSSGMIYFFYSAEQSAWGFDPKDEGKFRVFYFDDEVSQLKRAEFPSDLADNERFASSSVMFENSISLPDFESKLLSEIFSQEELDTYLDMITEGNITKLLGYSDNIQGSMEEQCQLVTNGIYLGDPSGYRSSQAATLAKGADRWILLFQLDSIEDLGMMWGDVGRLYFWIKAEDLAKKNFEKSWCVLQCS